MNTMRRKKKNDEHIEAKEQRISINRKEEKSFLAFFF